MADITIDRDNSIHHRPIDTILHENLDTLSNHFRRISTSDDIDSGIAKIKKIAVVKASAYDGLDIISSPRFLIEKLFEPNILGFESDSDLISGKYEGGFKIWESTYDLIKFINHDQTIIGKILEDNRKIRVLELGAGASLGSIAFLKRLLGNSNFKSNYRFHVQDYNWQVLSTLTLVNFVLNFSLDFVVEAIDLKYLRMFPGDWKHFKYRHKYHLIMMSEVLYNEDFYDSLHTLLDNQLKDSGVIVIATKNTYFGLSGSLYRWLEFLKQKNSFYPANVIKVEENNIPRSILILRRVSSGKIL